MDALGRRAGDRPGHPHHQTVEAGGPAAVLSAPLRAAASTTTVPRASAAISRLRIRKRRSWARSRAAARHDEAGLGDVVDRARWPTGRPGPRRRPGPRGGAPAPARRGARPGRCRTRRPRPRTPRPRSGRRALRRPRRRRWWPSASRPRRPRGRAVQAARPRTHRPRGAAAPLTLAPRQVVQPLGHSGHRGRRSGSPAPGPLEVASGRGHATAQRRRWGGPRPSRSSRSCP